MYSYRNKSFFFFIGSLCALSLLTFPKARVSCRGHTVFSCPQYKACLCLVYGLSMHVSCLWVAFHPWVLQAIKIPGKIVLLEFSPQFPFMTLCYYPAIVWHLQIAHTWKQKHPKYHPNITTVSLWYSILYHHQYRFIWLTCIIRAQALFTTRIPSSRLGTKNTCEKLSFSPSLRAFKWPWRRGASDKGGVGREMTKGNWLCKLTIGTRCGSKLFENLKSIGGMNYHWFSLADSL